MPATEAELRAVRRAYARRTLVLAKVVDEQLENAFATVRREDFLPPGPWPIFQRTGTYEYTPDADPVHLYTDDLVGIAPNDASTMDSRACMPSCSRTLVFGWAIT